MGAFDDLLPPGPTTPPAAKVGAFDDLLPPVAAAPAGPTPVYSGSILPLTRYSDGSVAFDPRAGLLGPITRGIDLVKGVATGAIDPTSPAAIAGAANLAAYASPVGPDSMVAAKVIPPTAQALHDAAGAGYDAARNTGVEYSSQAVADMARNAQAALNERGILSVNAPKTHTILDMLQDVPSGDSVVPFGSLDSARKAFGFAAGDRTEQRAASSAKAAIDGFVTSPPPGAVSPALAGPAASAADLVTAARANAAAGFRSDAINGIERAVDLRSSSANSGANIGNTTRGRITSLLLDKNASAGFSPDEISALEDVVHGSLAANAARRLANMAGGGGGMGHSLVAGAGGVLGAALGGEAGAVLGATGATAVGPALKAVQNGLDTSALSAVDKAVRSRSPLFDEMQANAPQVVASPLLASAARIPVGVGLMGSGPAASVNHAAPDSRAAALAQTLTRARQPPQGGGLGSIFASPGTI